MTTETYWRYFIEDDENYVIKYGISKGEYPSNNVTCYDKIETPFINEDGNGITKERVIKCECSFEYCVLKNVNKTSWLNGEEEY